MDVTINSAITFNVGDNLDIKTGTSLSAIQNVIINVDPSAGDPDTFGATVTIAGSVSGGPVEINGGGDTDTFNIQRTAAPTTLNACLGADTINLSSDAFTNSITLDQITGTLMINGDDGSDTLNISDLGDVSGDGGGSLTSTQLSCKGGAAITYATVEILNIDLGSSDDTFTIESTSNSTNTTVDGNDGDDTFNVGNLTNSLDDILGILTFKGNAPSASDVLNIYDQDDGKDNTYSATPTTLNRTGMAQLTYGTIEDLFLNAGAGSDTITISNTHSKATTANANDGADIITVQMTSGEITVIGQGGDDQIIVQTTGAGQIMTANGDAGQDSFTVQATGLGSTTTLNGGTNADIFNVQTIAGDTMINAGSG